MLREKDKLVLPSFANWYRGKTALVTGATSGIGRELAKHLVYYGAKVLACGRDKEALGSLAEELNSFRAFSLQGFLTDFSEEGSLQELIAQTDNDCDIDILVNNAAFGYINDFCSMPQDKINAMQEVNIFYVTNLCRAFLPKMVKKGQGGILNVGSTASFFATPGSALYGATKHFILGFTDALHHELEPSGVHVTGLYPGHTYTRFAQRATEGRVNNWRKAMNPQQVAKSGLRGLSENKIRVIPGFSNKMRAAAAFVLPPRIILKKIYNTALAYRRV